MEPLTPAFFRRDTLEVAPDLVGQLLVYEQPPPAPVLVGRIVETEAYTHDDPACHAWGLGRDGRPIRGRGAGLFAAPGTSYVYLNYGIYWLLNVVTEPRGVAGAVLIRAVEPIAGRELMRARRPAARTDRDLTNGPGKLSMAFGIDGRHHAKPLTAPPLFLARSGRAENIRVETSPRIGISKAAERPWRFFEAGNPYVSPRR